MTGVQHKSLADGRWNAFTLHEQLANVGSEVERAINWRIKGNADYSQRAYHRALELLDFTRADPKNAARLRELCRVREALVDFFQYANEYGSTDTSWRRYFGAFTFAARRAR
jgi:hypothetical protein